MGSRHTKLTREDYRPWLKPLRIGGPTNCKRKALVLTNYTSDGSEIQKARTPVRFAGLKSSLDTTFGSIINQEVLASQRLWHFFFEPDPSAPSFFLRSARLPSVTSALGCTPGTSTSRRLENLLRMSSLRYFNSGDALRKKTSKPKIRAEMLDGLGGCRGNYQGLSYVP